MRLKYFLETCRLTGGIYRNLREKKNNAVRRSEEQMNFRWHGVFDDRQNGEKKLCIILAGYKTFLYDITFERIKAFIEKDIDVCVITSGIFSTDIQEMCKNEGWSYLSTEENNVALVQNVAIQLHPDAEWIYKLDEDMFVTKDYFRNMMAAYEHADTGRYNVGVMAPLIPVNGYGYVRILEKMNAVEEYTDRFESPKYATGAERSIEGDPDAAKFMWGSGDYLPSIDYMNDLFQKDPLEERACAIRFSIGAILFKRSFWDEMGHFKVVPGPGMGYDEVQLCHYCSANDRPLVVSENVVVGHLSFGNQNEEMKKFFMENRDRFAL